MGTDPGPCFPERILLVTDMDDLSRSLPVGIRYALDCSAQLRIHHFIQETFHSAVEGDAPEQQKIRTLENAVARARTAGVQAYWSMQPGPLEPGIKQITREWTADRVIVACRPSSDCNEVLLDALSGSVLREAEIPVLVVGPQATADKFSTSTNPLRILFATTLDSKARLVAEYVDRFAGILHAEMTMLHIIANRSPSHPSLARVRFYAEQRCQEVLAELKHDVVHYRIEQGAIEDTIVKVIGEGEFDLLLIGAVSGSSFRSDILPGIAYNIVCVSPCPVMVLKNDSFPRIGLQTLMKDNQSHDATSLSRLRTRPSAREDMLSSR